MIEGFRIQNFRSLKDRQGSKIKTIPTHHVGSFSDQHFSFDKDWTGKPGTCQAVVLDGMNSVQIREGQFILTSHSVEVWERYEQSGMRIELGSKPLITTGRFTNQEEYYEAMA